MNDEYDYRIKRLAEFNQALKNQQASAVTLNRAEMMLILVLLEEEIDFLEDVEEEWENDGQEIYGLYDRPPDREMHIKVIKSLLDKISIVIQQAEDAEKAADKTNYN